jgi:hypothetical protein
MPAPEFCLQTRKKAAHEERPKSREETPKKGCSSKARLDAAMHK